MNKLHLLILFFLLAGISVIHNTLPDNQNAIEVVANEDVESPEDIEPDEVRYEALHPEDAWMTVFIHDDRSTRSGYSYQFSVQTAWRRILVPPPRFG